MSYGFFRSITRIPYLTHFDLFFAPPPRPISYRFFRPITRIPGLPLGSSFSDSDIDALDGGMLCCVGSGVTKTAAHSRDLFGA